MMGENESAVLTITDLKQYAYCQRVLYFEKCLPHIRPRTGKMDSGALAHERERKRAGRRKLKQYGLVDGKREFDMRLLSERLGLSALLDEVVFSEDGAIYPVDYKMAKHVAYNHRIQLTAYAILLEEAYQTEILEGFIYLIPRRETHRIPITSRLRNALLALLSSAHDMIVSERMPAPNNKKGRCSVCEFRRFCNDT